MSSLASNLLYEFCFQQGEGFSHIQHHNLREKDLNWTKLKRPDMNSIMRAFVGRRRHVLDVSFCWTILFLCDRRSLRWFLLKQSFLVISSFINIYLASYQLVKYSSTITPRIQRL